MSAAGEASRPLERHRRRSCAMALRMALATLGGTGAAHAFALPGSSTSVKWPSPGSLTGSGENILQTGLTESQFLDPISNPGLFSLIALLETLGWRGIFLTVVPFGLAALCLAVPAIPESSDPEDRHFGLEAQLLGALALGGLVLAAIEGHGSGVIAAAALGVGMLGTAYELAGGVASGLRAALFAGGVVQLGSAAVAWITARHGRPGLRAISHGSPHRPGRQHDLRRGHAGRRSRVSSRDEGGLYFLPVQAWIMAGFALPFSDCPAEQHRTMSPPGFPQRRASRDTRLHRGDHGG